MVLKQRLERARAALANITRRRPSVGSNGSAASNQHG
jgi:hypothetical protein